MKHLLLTLVLLAAVSGTAHAFTYTIINSNGGASINGENSGKKAGLRCLAMHEGANLGGDYWACPSGEHCYHGYNGGGIGGSPPGQHHYAVSNCRDNAAQGPGFRDCDVYRNGQLRWRLMYKQGYWAVSYWDLLSNAFSGTCDKPANTLSFQ
jgi:hypothetical protein